MSALRFARLATVPPLLVAALAMVPSPLAGEEVTGAAQPEEPGELRPRMEAALEKAQEWLDRLTVNAAQLQSQGVKGKKKVGEILAAYLDLLRHTKDGEAREAINARARAIAEQTRGPGWHNMATCSEAELTQNSMSYLRVLKLMEELGLETGSYKEELGKAKPRLDEHVAGRGPWQRAVFAAYYDRFGLERPGSLNGAEGEKGIIARRLPADAFNAIQAYQLTHQVFAAYDYGGRRKQSRLGPEEIAYLGEVLPGLVERAVKVADPDLLAEFLSSLAYIGRMEDPAWRRGMDWLLKAQKADGSWGEYSRTKHGPFTDQKLTLHTVGVAIQALVAALER